MHPVKIHPVKSGIHPAKGQGYTVKVKLQNPDHYPVQIVYRFEGRFVRDTSYTIKNGWKIFRGKVNKPVLATLVVLGDPALMVPIKRKGRSSIIPAPQLHFFLSNDVIKITGDADTIYKAAVQGGKANNEWAAIKEKVGKLTQETWSAIKTKVKATRKINKLHKQFIKKHPNSLVSMYFLTTLVNTMSLEDLKTTYASLGNKYKNSIFGQRIEEKIEGVEAATVGKMAPPINKKDLMINRLRLKD